MERPTTNDQRPTTNDHGRVGPQRTLRIMVIALCVVVALALILYASRGLALVWDLFEFLWTGKKQT
jgi:hypothetical protein